jgi:SET domain-containing protein
MGMLNDSHGTLYSNNCKFVVDLENDTVSVWSIRDIKEGDELFISYGEEYWTP